MIRVTDNSNQEIKQNDLNVNLVDKPSKVNYIDHKLGKIFSVSPWFSLLFCHNIFPNRKSWIRWIGHSIIEIVEEISEEIIDTFITICSLLKRSKNFVKTTKDKNPNKREDCER